MERSIRGRRRELALLVAAGLVAAGSTAGAALAVSSAKPAKAPKAKESKAKASKQESTSQAKLTLCHKGKVTIRVAATALPAHARHGDAQRACTEAELAASKAKSKEAKDKANNGDDDAE
jgi:hypothetical protein